jgi:hypothetical protein
MSYKKARRKKRLQKIFIFILAVLGLLKLLFENEIYTFAHDDIKFLGQFSINVLVNIIGFSNQLFLFFIL